MGLRDRIENVTDDLRGQAGEAAGNVMDGSPSESEGNSSTEGNDSREGNSSFEDASSNYEDNAPRGNTSEFESNGFEQGNDAENNRGENLRGVTDDYDS